MGRIVMLGWLGPGLLGSTLIAFAAFSAGCEDRSQENDMRAQPEQQRSVQQASKVASTR